MSNSLPVPLRFVPTLTDVVQPGFLSPTATTRLLSPPLQADFSETVAIPLAPLAQEGILAQRVLQRIELVLAQRLREVVDQVVQEHTQALAPRLRQEIELAVRESVVQAFEQETQG